MLYTNKGTIHACATLHIACVGYALHNSVQIWTAFCAHFTQALCKVPALHQIVRYDG